MHVLGASGRGKSKFLECLIEQDILHGNGLCLIDPHGYLYEDILRWCTAKGLYGRRKIALLNPSEEGWTFGFNPLMFGEGIEASFCVDAMVNACAQVWGGEDASRTPLLKRCLRSVFAALADRHLTLLEAMDLADPSDLAGIRQLITREIEDGFFKDQWRRINALHEREFREDFASTHNRLMEFLSAEVIRRIVGQQEHIVDWRKCMDEGYVVLVNLATKGTLSPDNSRLLGTLIVNDLLVKAQSRPQGSRPFYLYIDECTRYINEDIGRILDEARKFGLHAILAHQHLSQLKRAGEQVYSAVMTNAQTKVVFGGLSSEDAEVMAQDIFMGELNLQEPKPVYDQFQVVGHTREWMRNVSRGQSQGINQSTTMTHSNAHHVGEMDSESESVQMSEASGRSRRYSTPSGEFTEEGESSSSSSGRGSQRTRSRTEGTSWTDSDSDTRGESFTESESQGASEQLVPIMEKRPGQAYTLQEQIYRAKALMVNQPTQEAILKLPNQRSMRIRTPDVRDYTLKDEWVERFKGRVLEAADFTQPVDTIDRAITSRTLELRQKAQDLLNPPDPESYLEG